MMVDTDRRRFLRYAASLAAVLLENKVDETLEPNGEARNASRTATLAADNTSQHRGDEWNTGYKQRSDGKSPTTVENVKEIGTLSVGEFKGPPVTTAGGQYGVQGEGVAAIANSEADSFIELDAAGLTSPLVFFGEERASFGDSAGIKEIDTTTGDQTDIIDDFAGAAAGAYAKYNGKAYKARSNGVEEIDQETFESNVLDDTNSMATGNFIVLEGGETAVMWEDKDLIRYDIDSETEVQKREYVDVAGSGLSSDGDTSSGLQVTIR